MRCSNGPVPTKQLLAAAATAGGDRLERDRSLELRHGLPLRPGRYHDTGCVEHLNLKKKGTKSSRESLVEERETGTDGEHRKGLTRGSFRPGTCPVTPQTSTGKWLTMAYAAVGMPLLLLYLSVAGASLSSCLCLGLGLRRSKRLQLVQT